MSSTFDRPPPKWDNQQTIDRFLIAFNSYCASKGINKVKRKMHLLAQCFPEAMGIQLAQRANTLQASQASWTTFINHVKSTIQANQPRSAYNMMRQRLLSAEMRQQRSEDVAIFKDRFEYEVSQYNAEARKLGKNRYEGSERVDLFQSLLLPGYAIYLGEQRIKIEDQNIARDDTMANAFKHCARYNEILRLRRTTHMKGALHLDSVTPLETFESEETQQRPQQRSFGESIRSDTSKRDTKGDTDEKEGDPATDPPRGAALKDRTDSTRSLRDSDMEQNSRKPRLIPPWTQMDLPEIHGFAPPSLASLQSGQMISWCTWCGTEDHKSRHCPNHCPRCDGQHRLEDCRQNHYDITCSYCDRKGHVESVCHIKRQGDYRGTSQIGGTQRRPRQTGNPPTTPFQGGGHGPRPCRFWKENNCFRGSNCPWPHVGQGGTAEAPEWYNNRGDQSGNTGNNHNLQRNRADKRGRETDSQREHKKILKVIKRDEQERRKERKEMKRIISEAKRSNAQNQQPQPPQIPCYSAPAHIPPWYHNLPYAQVMQMQHAQDNEETNDGGRRRKNKRRKPDKIKEKTASASSSSDESDDK